MSITASYIKDYIEELTQMDLTAKTRKRAVVDVRRVAFKVTKSLTRISLTSIGELYNKDHATVLHGIKTFDNLYDSPDFKESRDLYKKIYGTFLEIQQNLGISDKIKNVDQLNFEYRNKIESLVQDHKEKMSNLMIQNSRLLTNPIFDKMSRLPEAEFQDLQIRVNAFFQMNAMNSERKRLRNAI
jgi:chromosomal replication initiation ATPase DnaA